LAEALGLKAPTVHNLMRTLTARGYLRRDTEPVRYRLGPAFAEISRRRAPRALLIAAERELKALHHAEPDVVLTLAEASAHLVAVVLRVSPEAPGIVQRPTAQVLNPYSSSSALLFQAFWSEEQRSAFELLHPFWESAAPLWKTPEALLAFLSDTRRTGVAAIHFEGETIVKVSVPVRHPDGTIAAALGLSAPARTLTADRRKRLIDSLKAAAVRLVAA
jgi:DNA-binding IclR family transcriptional regulator